MLPFLSKNLRGIMKYLMKAIIKPKILKTFYSKACDLSDNENLIHPDLIKLLTTTTTLKED